LQGRKQDISLCIFFDGKIDGAVTEIANAVEQYDGFLDHILQR